MFFLGIDCGTQGTKAVLLDLNKKSIIAQGYAPHTMEYNERGGREQHPDIWVTAFKTAFKEMVTKYGLQRELPNIVAIGVSGQQHGLVVLDTEKKVIRPAKLWCDTETSLENEELIKTLGGKDQVIRKCGLELLTGYTASKLLWLKKHEPDNYKKIKYIFLPHDYLNFYLTGEYVAEPGDSSGTGYYDVQKNAWNAEILKAIDSKKDLLGLLPRLILPHEPVGKVRSELVKELGLSQNVIVSSGGGDNMMGAIGSANVTPGGITMSLGTSGTVYVSSETPIRISDLSKKSTDTSLIANFCSSHGGWLPLTCHMNVTSTTSQMQKMLGLSMRDFFTQAAKAPLGAGGIIMVPFLNGERVPNLPEHRGSIHYLATQNTTSANLARAAIEGASFSVYYGYELLNKAKHEIEILATTKESKTIRLIGGGAKSDFWCQLMADLTGVQVVTLEQEEVAALGAAIQAAWCYFDNLKPEPKKLKSLAKIVKELVSVKKTFIPNMANHQSYQVVYQKYLDSVNNFSG